MPTVNYCRILAWSLAESAAHPTETAPLSVGIPGVAVRLNCTTLLGNVVTLAQGVTNSTGVFNLTLPNLLGTLGTVLPCNVVAILPLNSTVCPILSTVNGTLTSVPVLVNALLSSLLGPIFNFAVGVLSIVRIG